MTNYFWTRPDVTNLNFLHVRMFTAGRVIHVAVAVSLRPALLCITGQTRQCITMSNTEAGKRAAAFAAIDENIKVT